MKTLGKVISIFQSILFRFLNIGRHNWEIGAGWENNDISRIFLRFIQSLFEVYEIYSKLKTRNGFALPHCLETF